MRRNLCRWLQDETPFAHQRVGDDERRIGAGEDAFAPQDDVEVKHAAGPVLAAPPAIGTFDCLQFGNQLRRSGPGRQDNRGIGIAAAGWSDRPGRHGPRLRSHGADAGEVGQCLLQHLPRPAVSLVAAVGAEGNEIVCFRHGEPGNIATMGQLEQIVPTGIAGCYHVQQQWETREIMVRFGSMKMAGVAALTVMLASCGGNDGQSPGEVSGNVARAQLTGVDGTSYGEVIVARGDDGLLVNVNAANMTPGPHGVHIHQTGKCEGPDFSSAGGHWNPTGVQHGFDNPEGAHKGDLVNLDIGPDGTGSLEASIYGATLSEGENALLDEDGAAFIVHEGPDDLKTDPSGESGGRLACGVFEQGR